MSGYSTDRRYALIDTKERRGFSVEGFNSLEGVLMHAAHLLIARSEDHEDGERALARVRHSIDLLEERMRAEGFHLRAPDREPTP